MLTSQQIEQFNEDGYLAVDRLLDYELDIKPVIAEYDQLLDDLCQQWFADGLISDLFSDLPFEKRLVEAYKAGCNYAQHFDIALPNSNIQADTPIHLGPAVFNFLRSPRLLSAVESIIGSEIYSNPIQHVRIKPPSRVVPSGQRSSALVSRTLWHQDSGVSLPEADDTQMVTCWVAITEATVENGCLQVVPGSHKAGVELHCSGDQVGIPEKLIEQEKVKPIPLNPGGVLFFHPLCKHSSLDNHSDAFRWSFDLRFNPIGQPTGRPHFPGFIAQSRLHPEQVLSDPTAWAQLWLDARDQLAEKTNIPVHRWGGDDPLCA